MAGKTFSPLVAPLAMAMYAYQQYYGTPPSLQPWLKEPYASGLATRVEDQCVLQLAAWLGAGRVASVFKGEMIAALAAGRWEDLQPGAPPLPSTRRAS